jgi:hypothetical protein
MLKSIFGFIGGLFSSDKATDTVIDIIRDKTGVDELNSKDKVEAMLKWIDKTKHQSPTRRFLALATMLGIVLFTGVWLFTGFVEAFYIFYMTDTSSVALASSTSNTAKIAVQPLTTLRNNIITMLDTNLKIPFTTIFAFYFGSQFINKIKSGD